MIISINCKLIKLILLQKTANMCETGHNNMTFTIVELKIALEYLGAYLIYTNFAYNSLKQPILSILSTFQLLKNLKKIFAANHCEYV